MNAEPLKLPEWTDFCGLSVLWIFQSINDSVINQGGGFPREQQTVTPDLSIAVLLAKHNYVLFEKWRSTISCYRFLASQRNISFRKEVKKYMKNYFHSICMKEKHLFWLMSHDRKRNDARYSVPTQAENLPSFITWRWRSTKALPKNLS